MSFMNTRYNFGFPTILLHWLLFILIVGMIAGGLYSDSLASGEKDKDLIAIHKQIGVAVLGLMFFRMLWRLINTSVNSFTESGLLSMISFLNHWLLYLVVMAQAAGGIMMSQLSGRAVTFLGIKLPDMTGSLGELTAQQLRQWHDYGGKALIALIGLHLLGALVHHFYFSDDTLRRMWFSYRPTYTDEKHY